MNNKIFKDSFFILVANGMTFVTAMIITRVISSNFSLSDYGFRSQILTIVSVFNSFFSLGLSNAANYFIPLTDNSDGLSWTKILRNIYIIAAPICLMVFLVIVLFIEQISYYFKNTELIEYRFLIVIMISEQIIYNLYAGTQISQHKALRSTLTNLCRSVATVVMVVLICHSRGSIINIIVGTLCVDAVFCTYTIFDSTRVFVKVGKWFDVGLIKRILIYCVPLGLSTITGTLCAQIDKIFISKLLSLEDLAIYTNMCTELPLAAISGAFIAVLTPYVVKLIGQDEAEKAVNLWGNYVELVAIILFPIIMALIIFSRQAIVLLYSEKYLMGIHLFRMFAILEISRITYFGMILRSYGKSILILMCSGMTLIVNVVLNAFFYFVLSLGMNGFAIATMVSTFSIQILQLAMSSQITGISFYKIFPWKELGSCLLTNAGIGFIIGTISKWIGFYDRNSIWPVLIIGMVWAVVYFLIEYSRIKKIYGITKNADL